MTMKNLKYVCSSQSFVKCLRQYAKKAAEKGKKVEIEYRPDDIKVLDCGPDMTDRGICARDPCDPEKCYPQPKIVIIGAGMAGLSAAARLSQKGITNYVILEALERPGGRIHSCWYSDSVVEFGAGKTADLSSTHPLTRLTASEDPPVPGVPGSQCPCGLLNRVVPGKLDFSPTVVAYYKFRQIEQEAAQIYCLGGYKQQGSLLNFMSIRIQQEIQEFPEDQRHDVARILFGLVHLLSAKSGSDISMLCADNSGCYMNLPGAELRVPLGSVGTLAPMLCHIPQGAIRFCKRVDCVYWGTAKKSDSGHRIVVCTIDGDEFPADYAIITVSLGVLQHNYNKLFCPALPSTKVEAMRRLGYGFCNKIYMEYSRPFWVWNTHETLSFEFCNNECARSDWTRGITEIAPVPNSKHVLSVTVVGLEAMYMEGQSDGDVAEGVTDLLRYCTGICNLPYPQSILRSHWSSSPLFAGAYSYDYRHSEGEAQRELSCPLPGPNEPVPMMLFFAGEATVPGHFATVAGAQISGIREAERIVQLTLRYKGPPDMSNIKDMRCQIDSD